MDILAIGNKIISETLNMPDDLKPTEREIAAMVSFLHKLSSKAKPELAALSEAGKKMAERLRENRSASAMANSTIQKVLLFSQKDADALAEWEAANK